MWPTAIPVGKPRSTQAALHGPEPRASRTCTALEAQPGPLPQASEYGCPGWGLKDRLIGPRSGQNLRSSDSHGHQQVRPKGRKSVAGWLVQGLEEQRGGGGRRGGWGQRNAPVQVGGRALAEQSAWVVLLKTLSYQTACSGRRGAQAGSPSRSTRIELPSSSEKPMSAQGRNGAWKVRRPKKLTLT